MSPTTETFTADANNQLTGASRGGTLTVAGTAASATQVTVNGQGAYLYSDKTWVVTGVPLTTTNLTAVATDGAGHAATHTITLNPATALSPQYDQNGNLLSDGRRSFTYDTENQLVSVLVTNGPLDATLSGFVYDGLSHRRIRTEAVWRPTGWVTNEVVRYLYDGNRVIQERDSSNTVLVTYTRGLDLSGTIEGAGGIGGLLARTHPGNHHFYYHSDANGNVTAIINQSTNLVAQYRYDPFGNLVAQTGPLAEGNLYRFSSKEFHQASGLYYYGYRFYDPNLQRWLNRDPIGEVGGINLYGFVQNNPVDYQDSFGMYVGGGAAVCQTFTVAAATLTIALASVPVGAVVTATIVVGATVEVTYAICNRPPAGIRYWNPSDVNAVPIIAKSPKMTKKCQKEWQDARDTCEAELAKPHPSRSITGGYTDIAGCAKGLVSEACGGNPVSKR